MLANSSKRYGVVAMTLHWLIAAAIVVMLGLGLYMSDLPLTDPGKLPLYQLHKSIGLTILALTVVRIAWRLVNPPPPLPASMKSWARAAAHVSHALLYLFTLAVPLAGWAMVSASELQIPTIWFGQFQVPDLPVARDAASEDGFELAHAAMAFALAGLLVVHVAAALKHHFFDGDSVLVRMLPFTRVE